MDMHVDRTLPMPIRQQLKGTIEFGIAFGELQVGEALPSVRELAQMVGVAPMTVTQVYRALKVDGLIETRRGSGTFVADSSQARIGARTDIDALHRQVDAVVDKALALGIRAGDLNALVNARLNFRARTLGRINVVMAGLFPEATASYAKFIAGRIGSRVTVEPITIDTIINDVAQRHHAGSADLVVTFANRHGEVQALLPNTKVASVRFIPSESTRMSLAAVSPLADLVVISRFPDFLPIIKSGVQRFAPHVDRVHAINFDDPGIGPLLSAADVVVYATGTEAVARRARVGVQIFEYRHNPDPADIDRVVLPYVTEAAAAAANEE